MKETRRDFLKKSGGCALGMVGLATQMHHLGMVSAMAQEAIDAQKDRPDTTYQALVLLFWAGGNDGNNMIIPNHNDSSVSNYANYSAVRLASGLAIDQATLLPVSVPRINNLTYGFHPALGPITGGINNGIHELYGMGKLAIVTNVGNLVRPMTKAQYQNGSIQKPYQLFSHSDQVNQAQTSVSEHPGVYRLGRAHLGPNDAGQRTADTHGDVDRRCTALHGRTDDSAACHRRRGNIAGRRA